MSAKIFINYRRDDSTGTAGRLHDQLAQRFGRKNLFMDVDHIPAGVDFVDYLNGQVAACNVFLVIIGPDWLDVTNEKGDHRLHDPDDFVAIEIAAALARNVRVIPVLVDGAGMPKVSDLPESLKPLVRRQAIELRNSHFGRDAKALIATVSEPFDGGSFRPRLRKVGLAGMATTAVLLVGLVGSFWTPYWSPPASREPPAQSSLGREPPAEPSVERGPVADPSVTGQPAGPSVERGRLPRLRVPSGPVADPFVTRQPAGLPEWMGHQRQILPPNVRVLNMAYWQLPPEWKLSFHSDGSIGMTEAEYEERKRDGTLPKLEAMLRVEEPSDEPRT